MANTALLNARRKQNDEFYTLYEYIQKEIDAYIEYNPGTFRNKIVLCPCDDPQKSNFTRFFVQNFKALGLKKLISTSCSPAGKGKLFIMLTGDSSTICQNLEGDGDFRSLEIRTLRDQADIIVTNPPFSLFREFVSWILQANKEFLIVGQIGMATYKKIFPAIKNNQMWIGATCNDEDMVFEVPEGAEVKPKDREKAERMGYRGNYTRQGNICWFTNLDHGLRHTPLLLKSMEDNLCFSRHKTLRENGYSHYYNYDGIDVPYVDAIPDDFDGVMGVPTSFLSRYDPDQFEIVDNGAYAPKTLDHRAYRSKNIICYEKDGQIVWQTPYTVSERKAGNGLRISENGLPGKLPYGRILIRKKQ